MADQFWDIISKIFISSPSFKIDYDTMKDLSCGICKKVMLNASQIICGCQFCRVCIDQYVLNGGKDCPTKMTDDCFKINLSGIDDVHLEKDCNLRIKSLIVKCPSNNCNTETEFGKIVIHWNDFHKDDLFHDETKECEPKVEQNESFTIDQLTRKNNLLRKKNKRLERTVEEMKGRIYDLELEKATERDSVALLMKEMLCFEDRLEYERFEPFLWVVDHFTERRMNEEYLYSEPFFVFKEGYKLRLLLYPNGAYNDSRFMSLYFEVIRGEFDQYLMWPFRYNVTLAVVSDGGDIVHSRTIYYLMHRSHQFAYERPWESANIGLGDSEFIGYADTVLTNDCLRIQCTVTKSPATISWTD